MADFHFVKGKTVEEQIASIDMILWQKRGILSGEPNIIGAIAPIPIFHNRELPALDGTIMQIVVPFNCSVPEAVIYFGVKEIEKLTLSITVETEARSKTDHVQVEKNLESFSLNWDLERGGIITCKVSEPAKVKNILIGFIAYPQLSDELQVQFIKDQLIRRTAPHVERSIRSGDEKTPQHPATETQSTERPHRRSNRG